MKPIREELDYLEVVGSCLDKVGLAIVRKAIYHLTAECCESICGQTGLVPRSV